MNKSQEWNGEILTSKKEVNNIFNLDFLDFLKALNQTQVKYILVGGYSVIIYGHSRTTGDMDLWLEQSTDNYENLTSAFDIFGMPIFDMTKERFLSNTMDVFSFGRPPVSIDLMTQVKGLKFAEAFANAQFFEIDDVKIRVLHLNDLRKAKKASNRPKDQDDLLNLPDPI